MRFLLKEISPLYLNLIEIIVSRKRFQVSKNVLYKLYHITSLFNHINKISKELFDKKRFLIFEKNYFINIRDLTIKILYKTFFDIFNNF